MKIKGTRIPYRLVDGYVEEYGEEFKKELLSDYPYISQEQLDNYLINLYELNKRYREVLELLVKNETLGKDIKTGKIAVSQNGMLALNGLGLFNKEKHIVYGADEIIDRALEGEE